MEKHPTSIKIETPDWFPYKLPDGNWYQQLVNSILVNFGPYFIHPEGSPYLGLSLNEQEQLAKMRRPTGRPPKWYLDRLRKATKQDYEKLLLACTEALVNAWSDPTQRLDYVNVYVKLPFNWRNNWDKDIPRCFVLGYDDWTITVGWRVDKIVTWLYNKGYSPYTASELRKSIYQILREQERFEFYYDYASTGSIIELYNEFVDDVKTGKAKAEKRRPSKLKEVVDKPHTIGV